MAQTGFTPIVTYNTATATTVPSAANLAQGELAVNVTDKKLYTKDSGGNVVLLASNGGDVTGPASSTNLAIPTFSGTGGKTLLDNSGATISAGVITATGFSGPLTGNVTGNVSGSSGSCTGNAATVTTNANLTGPITSVGNATSIASQTGTGTTFAMSASPTFTGTVGAADLTTTGNTILGNATTDTLNVGNGGIVKDASGRVTMSGQPAFTYTQSTFNNVTGDGTVYQMPFASQIFEQGGSNVTGGVFTAPVTGKYLLSFCVFVNNTGAAHTYKNVQLVTTNKTFRCTTSLIAANIWDTETFTLTVVAEMATGNTAYVTTQVSGSTKTVGVMGDNSGYSTFFSGHLVC